MLNHRFSSIDRRGFLHLGALAGVFCAVGCDGGGEPKPVETPPVEGGTRKRLKMIEDKAGEVPAKKK
jgi:hypothetical protein